MGEYTLQLVDRSGDVSVTRDPDQTTSAVDELVYPGVRFTPGVNVGAVYATISANTSGADFAQLRTSLGEVIDEVDISDLSAGDSVRLTPAFGETLTADETYDVVLGVETGDWTAGYTTAAPPWSSTNISIDGGVSYNATVNATRVNEATVGSDNVGQTLTFNRTTFEGASAVVTIAASPASNTTETTSLQNTRIDRTHTAISGWETTLPYDTSLEGTVFDDALIYFDGEFVNRGIVESVRSDEGRRNTRVGGRNAGHRLARGGASVTYENIAGFDALDDYIENYTPYAADVTEPSVETLTTNAEAQQADTQAEWDEILTATNDTDPIYVDGFGRLALAQSCWFAEAEDNHNSVLVSETRAAVSKTSNSNASQGDGVHIEEVGDYAEFSFTPDYDVPAGNARIYWRHAQVELNDFDNPPYKVTLDGSTVTTAPENSLLGSWQWRSRGISGGLNAGQTYTVRLEATATNSFGMNLDCLAVADTRYSYNFDNSTDANDNLAGPELYPEAFRTEWFEFASTPFNISKGYINVNAPSVSGPFLLGFQLREGGPVYSGSNTRSFSQGTTTSKPSSNIRGRVTLGRYGFRNTASPKRGFEGQRIDSWRLGYDGNDLGIINSQHFDGSHIENLQRLCELTGLRFVVKNDAANDTIAVFKRGDVEIDTPDWKVLNRVRDLTVKDYANTVTARGGLDEDGDRITVTAQSESGVDEYGEVEWNFTNPAMETADDVASGARKELGGRVTEDELRGELTVAPINVEAGYSYQVDWGGGDVTKVPLERVSFSHQSGGGSASARLEFDLSRSFAQQLSEARRKLQNTESRL